MVSFVSITKGIFLLSMMLARSSHAASPSSEIPSDIPLNNLYKPSNFTLPPFISNRTRPAPSHLKINSNHVQNMAENIEWLKELGIDYPSMLQRGELETLYGMTLDLPANVPMNRLDGNFGDVVITATTTEIETFRYFAAIAATAYCRDVTGIGNWNCKNCKEYVPDGKLIYTFNSLITDTTGFIMRSDSQRTINIVFRGTSSIRQTVTYAVVAQSDYLPVNGAHVHTGFYDSYMEASDKYFPYAQQQLILFPDYKVVISGHSLGGAHALLAGLDLYQRDSRFGPENMSIYTVGCPRVGDTSFAYYVDSTGIPFYRSVNNRDVFPHFPPRDMGYLHSGIEIWDIPYNGVHICPSNIESEYCSNTIVPITSFFDHLTYYGINEGLCH